jgi:hypothetical protein
MAGRGAGARPAMPAIGLFSLAAADVFAEDMRAFHKGLGDARYVEGRNVLIEYHWLEDAVDFQRLADQFCHVAGPVARRTISDTRVMLQPDRNLL